MPNRTHAPSHPAPHPADFGFTRRVDVAAEPDALYDLISDVSNISHWSPTADHVRYDEGHGPTPGAWFVGMNHRNGKTWQSRSQVEHADPAATFSFVVGGLEDGIVHWRWTFSPARGGKTAVSLTWSLLRLDPVLGESRSEILELQDFMATSVESTLAALARHFAPTAPPTAA